MVLPLARAAVISAGFRVRHVRSDVDRAVGRHVLPAHHTHPHRRALRSPLGGSSCCCGGGRRLREALLVRG